MPPHPDPTRGRSGTRVLLRRLGAVALGVSFALLASELAVRAAGLAPPDRSEPGEGALARGVAPGEAPELAYRLREGARRVDRFPLADGSVRAVEYRVDDAGFRDSGRSLAREEGALRVAVVGDSFVYGTAVAEEDTLPRALETALAWHTGGRPVQALNWGVYGYNTLQEAALLEESLARYEVDLVVLVAYVNDASGKGVGPPTYATDDWEPRLIRSLGLTSGIRPADELRTWQQRCTAWLRSVSDLADVAAHRTYGALYGRVRDRHYRLDWRPGSPGVRAVRVGLARAAEACAARGVPLHVVWYPDVRGLAREVHPHEEPRACFTKVVTSAGLPFHDLTDALEGLDPGALVAHAHDHHPSPDCHRVAAEWLAERLAPSVATELAERR